ncbi:MAG: hypothetical protein Q6363_007550, partial [Candidatus Njordarchaeota archaeon]
MESEEKVPEKLSMEGLIEKYKQARKYRRIYALKAFFKMKRGFFGVAVLVMLSMLSLLSPIIAPNPNASVHAPLSKPGWMKIFDPYAVDDTFIVDNHISSSDDLGTSEDIGKIYYEHEISPSSKFEFEGVFFDPNDGYMQNGSAVMKVLDNVSEPIELSISELNQTLLRLSYEFKFRWDKDVTPYVSYLAFAHKFVIDVPAIYNRSWSIDPDKTVEDVVSIPVNFTYSVLRVDILGESSDTEIQIVYITSSGKVVLNETLTEKFLIKTKFLVSDGDKIYITNKKEKSVSVRVTIKPQGRDIYP